MCSMQLACLGMLPSSLLLVLACPGTGHGYMLKDSVMYLANPQACLPKSHAPCRKGHLMGH